MEEEKKEESKSFSELGICEPLVEACDRLGWNFPTKILSEAIPHALQGKDIIGLAQTGSGKTGAFALTIVQALLDSKSPQPFFGCVLSPTRELAIQIAEQFEALGTDIGLRTAVESKSSRTFLKNLYWLISSSLSHNVTSDDPGAENGLNIMDTTLSSALFEKLHDTSSLSSFLISTNQNVGDALSNIDGKDLVEELLLLFRCCVLMVRLNPNDLILLQKFQHAVSLYGLFPFRETFDKLYKGRMKHSSSYLYLLKQMLEVFLDEMFADRSLRESIAALESLSSKEQRSELSSIHMEIILDAIAAHFLLSITREQSFKTFYQSLVWMESKTPYTPELSLSAAISLIKHPIMSSSTVLHAHLISLVSQVIGISRSEVSPNIRYTEIYMSAFHESVILYSRVLAKLLLNTSINSSKQSKSAWKNFRQPQSEVYAKVNSVIADWEGSWRVQRGNLFTDTRLYLISDAISYLEANINIFNESSRNNTLSFLSSLVTLISADLDQDMLHRMKEMTMQDFCLLSSIMKLMSCSMLQGVRCCLNSTSKKKVTFPGWEYLVDSLDRFKKCNHIPVYVNQFIVDGLKSHFSISDDAIMIFIHFSYLLSMCIATGLDFLVRACLFLMMVSMEGFFFEASFVKNPSSSVNSGPPHSSPLNVTRVTSCITHEQQPVISPHMLEPEEERCSRSHSSKGVETVKHETKYRHSQRRKASMRSARIRVVNQCARRVSSFRVASDFQSTRTLLRDKEPRTTNGVAFLKCISKDAAIISELADFIECQEGKDYNAYLKKKEMLRNKKLIKIVKRRWEKRKMIFSLMSNESSKRNSN